MTEIRFTDQHEWVRLEGDIATIGITKYAAEQLGDVVYVELPSPGKTIGKATEAAVVESVKAASEVYAPVSGTVVESNGAIASEPAKVNEDPEGAGWFVKLRVSNRDEILELMTRDAYDGFVQGL